MGRSDHKKIPRHLCECGCGMQVNKHRSRFIRGHNSKFMTGIKNSFYCKKHAKFTRQCMSMSLINKNITEKGVKK